MMYYCFNAQMDLMCQRCLRIFLAHVALCVCVCACVYLISMVLVLNYSGLIKWVRKRSIHFYATE